MHDVSDIQIIQSIFDFADVVCGYTSEQHGRLWAVERQDFLDVPQIGAALQQMGFVPARAGTLSDGMV